MNSNLRHSIKSLLNRLRFLTPNKMTYVIGISGFPGAGKTKMSLDLASFLSSENYNTVVIHQDDFRIEKSLRLKDNGEFNYHDLPFINQWHNWKDLMKVLNEAITSHDNSSIKYYKYDSNTKLRSKLSKISIKKDKPLVIIIEGAFIFNLGKRNVYGVAPNAINSLLDLKIFIHIGNQDVFDKENFIKVLLSRSSKDISDKMIKEKEKNRALKYVEVVNNSIKEAIPFWKTADLIISNENFHKPIIIKPE